MYKLNNNGFGLVPALLIILIMIAAGFSGYHVYKQENKPESSQTSSEQQKTQEKEAEKSPSPSTETPKNTLPSGWKKSSSTVLGFEFPYPEEWGEPEIKKLEMPHTGKAYEIAFRAQDIYGMMISADYKYTGEGRGAPSWYISKPFSEAFKGVLDSAAQYPNSQGGASIEVLKKNANSVIDTSFNCADGGVPITLTSKLPKAGFDVLSMAQAKPSNVPTCELEPSDKPSKYTDNKVVEQFEKLSELLNQ